MDERILLRRTFNDVAELYDEVRPCYLPEVVDAVVESIRDRAGARILEIGAGTGQLTMELARRGYRVVAIEPGDALAGVLRQKGRPFPNLEVVTTTFEDWPMEAAAFDLVTAAQSFHWVDPEAGIPLAAMALRPGGTIALVWSIDVSQGTPFYQATQPLYDRYFPADGPGSVLGTLHQRTEPYRIALAGSTTFGEPREVRHEWEQTWSRDGYLKLLSTYSDHITIPEPGKTSFFDEMAAIIDRMGGEVTRRFETFVLTAARR